MSNRRRLTAGAAVLLLALLPAACTGQSVDRDATNAELVSGTTNLWWFCDNGVLVYFTNGTGGDEFVHFNPYDTRCPRGTR